MNKYINLNLENIDKEHICCAIGDKKHQIGVDTKKEWLKNRIQEGHVFRKLDAQGKIFVEYAPLEYAWVPINGNNFIYIYCLWVAGSFKGNGYAKELLEYVIEEAKKNGKNGVCVISSKKKKTFLSEKSFFEHYGFKVVDTINDYELLSLSFNKEQPSFNECAKKMEIDSKDFTIYYSPECPYTVNCINEITSYANNHNIKINIIKIDSLASAKNVPCVFNNWANFKDGHFVSNTLLNKNSFEKLVNNK